MGGERGVKGRGKEGREGERMVEVKKGREGKRSSEHSPSSKFATTPLFVSIYGNNFFPGPLPTSV